MRYIGMIAKLDGVADSANDILTTNVDLPNKSIPVNIDFTGQPVGFATVNLFGHDLIAELDIDENILPPELAETLVGVVGGTISARKQSEITEWKLVSVGLTTNPADKRLTPIKRVNK